MQKTPLKFLQFLRPSLVSSFQIAVCINQMQTMAWCFTKIILMVEESFLVCNEHVSCSLDLMILEVFSNLNNSMKA